MKKIFLLIIIILSPQILLGQSADNIKNFVLFDISGSAGDLDFHKNRYLLLSEFLRFIEQKDSDFNEKDIEFYFFGSDSVLIESTRLKNFYQKLNHSINLFKTEKIDSLLADLVNEVKGENSYQEINDRTNIFNAYRDVLNIIAKNTSSLQSNAIYIFTDGVLLPGDISIESGKLNPTADSKIAAKIKTNLNRIINDQNTNGIPTFLIQTSVNESNDYFSFINPQYNRSDSIVVTITSKHGFWLNSTINHNENGRALSDLRSFISKSRQLILSTYLEGSESDRIKTIDKSLKFYAEIINNIINYHSLNSHIGLETDYSRGPNSSLNFSQSEFSNTDTKINIKNSFLSFVDTEVFVEPLLQKLNGMPYTDSSISPETICGTDSKDIELELCIYLAEGVLNMYFLHNNTNIGANKISDIANWLRKLETNENNISPKLDSLYSEYLKENPIGSNQSSPQSISLIETNISLSPISPAIEEERKSNSLEEAIILGLRDYIIKKTRQEVFNYYYQDIHSDIFEINSFLSDTLFYNFSKLIGNIETQSPSILQIRRAIENDLDSFLENLTLSNQIKENEKLLLLSLTTSLIQEFINEQNILLAFNELSKFTTDDYLENDATKQLIDSIKFIIQLLEQYENYDMYDYYNNMTDNLQKTAIKLLAISLVDTLNIDNSLHLNRVYKNILGFYEELERVQEYIERLSKEIDKIDPVQDFEEYQRYKRNAVIDMISDITSLLSHGISLYADLNLTDSNQINYKKRAYELERQISTVTDIYFSLQDGHYINAMSLTLPLLPDSLFIDGLNTDSTSIVTIPIDKIFKLISFSSEVATAQNAHDITNVLDRYALSPSSFKTKKEGTNSKWYLNSYSYINYSVLLEKKRSYPSISIPIGFEMAKPIGKDQTSSFSIFIPILDIGNTLKFDSKNNDETLNFGRIFSPGIHFVNSFSSRYPISFSTGYHVNPNRVVFNVGIDIPLFRIGN